MVDSLFKSGELLLETTAPEAVAPEVPPSPWLLNLMLVVFVVLAALSVVMMVRTSYYQQSRLTAWANGVAGGWYRGVHSVGGYFGLKGENDRLAAENARLRARLAESYISYTDTLFTCCMLSW